MQHVHYNPRMVRIARILLCCGTWEIFCWTIQSEIRTRNINHIIFICDIMTYICHNYDQHMPQSLILWISADFIHISQTVIYPPMVEWSFAPQPVKQPWIIWKIQSHETALWIKAYQKTKPKVFTCYNALQNVIKTLAYRYSAKVIGHFVKVIRNGVKPFLNETVKKSCFHVDL